MFRSISFSVLIALCLVETVSCKGPVWPFQWNATLAKINPDNTHIWWTKFYYDFTIKSARFDFYNEYYNTSNEWTINCTILFTPDEDIWFTFPHEEVCTLDHQNIPTISPYWLSNATFTKSMFFRGMWVNEYFLDDGMKGIWYYARYGDYVPVRSTNQVNDPGATDYFDVVLGPQRKELFRLPSYCKNLSNMQCPPY